MCVSSRPYADSHNTLAACLDLADAEGEACLACCPGHWSAPGLSAENCGVVMATCCSGPCLCIPASLHVPIRMAPNYPDSIANEADASYVDRNALVLGYWSSWTMFRIALYYCICLELMLSSV